MPLALISSPVLGAILFFHGPGFRGILDILSQRAADWPFLFFLPWLALLMLARRFRTRLPLASLARTLAVGLCALTVLMFFLMIFSYLAANYIDNSYAALYAETAWQFCTHHPIYSDSHALAPYSLPYGPAGLIIIGCFQHVLGPTIFSSKLAPFLATTGVFVFIYLTCRTRTGWPLSLILTALAAALLVFFDPCEFWPRPDLFIVFCVSFGLWASTRNENWGPLLVAVALGLAVNMKVYTFLLFLPALSLILRHKMPLWILALAAIASIAIALAPFFLFPNVSLPDYFRVLKMDGGHRFNNALAIGNLEWLLALTFLVFAPVIILKADFDAKLAVVRRSADLIVPWFIAFVLVLYPASLEGAGPHHLMAFIPIAILLAADLFFECRNLVPAEAPFSLPGLAMILSECTFIAIYALSTTTSQIVFFHHKDAVEKRRVADVGSIFQEESGAILLNAPGSDTTRRDDSYRCLLVFNGMPIGIDPVVSMDYRNGGVREPDLAVFVRDIKDNGRRPVVFICPKDVTPFSLTSYFGTVQPLFSDKFRADFAAHFQLSGHSDFFDIYTER